MDEWTRITPRVGAPAREQRTGERGVLTGVDLMPVADVESSIERFGERYLSRVFTAHELASCRGTSKVVARGLAARFAAKEATLKVLRPRRSDPVDWRSIEVRRATSGACTLQLKDHAARLASEAGVVDISVALAHEGDLGVAVVVALCGEKLGTPVAAAGGRTTGGRQNS